MFGVWFVGMFEGGLFVIGVWLCGFVWISFDGIGIEVCIDWFDGCWVLMCVLWWLFIVYLCVGMIDVWIVLGLLMLSMML